MYFLLGFLALRGDNRSMRQSLTVLLSFWLCHSSLAAPLMPEAIKSDALGATINYRQEFDSFFDPNFDYSRFFGRVTDKDPTGQIYKIESETKNVRFFKVGDLVTFFVEGGDDGEDPCRAYVRDVEKDFFVLYVEDIRTCWRRDAYFRRGSRLRMTSDKLAQRVRDAGLFRVLLLRRRKDYFTQLNGINRFVWSFEQQKVQVAAEYDRRIAEMQAQKQKALDQLLSKKADQIRLQRELGQQLDEIDNDLEFYRIEREELALDRWEHDHDLGLPVGDRPQQAKTRP